MACHGHQLLLMVLHTSLPPLPGQHCWFLALVSSPQLRLCRRYLSLFSVLVLPLESWGEAGPCKRLFPWHKLETKDKQPGSHLATSPLHCTCYKQHTAENRSTSLAPFASNDIHGVLVVLCAGKEEKGEGRKKKKKKKVAFLNLCWQIVCGGRRAARDPCQTLRGRGSLRDGLGPGLRLSLQG